MTGQTEISEKADYHFSKVVFTPGTIFLTKDRLKWRKDYEFFFLTMIRRISFPDYGKDYSVDIRLSEITTISGDPAKKHDDLLVITLTNEKELRFSSSKWTVKDWITLIEERINKVN